MNPSRSIHLGCDTGEAADAAGLRRETELLQHVSMVHVACGGHAGDEKTMRTAVSNALRQGCSIGAHPSYPDREGFGRIPMDIERSALERSIRSQLQSLITVSESLGARIRHTKAHGALYHAISADAELAGWFYAINAEMIPDVSIVLPIGSNAIDSLRRAGISVLVEGFCDRAYEADGTLRPRHLEDALICDPDQAADQAERLVEEHQCDLLCVHGDTSGASQIASAVSTRLRIIAGD